MKYLILVFILISCATHRQPASDLTNTPTLNFILNEHYLALHTIKAITNWDNPQGIEMKEIVAFQKKVWDLYEEDYKLIINFKKIFPDYIENRKLKFMKEFAGKIAKLSEFVPIRERTSTYLDYVKNEWERNLPQTSTYMNDLTGLDFKYTWKIFVTHPVLRNGTQLGSLQIGWGSPEEWANHSTIYLWHEILHHYFGKSDIDHSVISLAAENELRKKMNGTNYPPFEGHDNLKKTMKKILPGWKKYLNKENKNLINFSRQY